MVQWEYEGLERACYAVQDGVKLVTRLLRAFPPLTAYLLTAADAAVTLLTILQVRS